MQRAFWSLAAPLLVACACGGSGNSTPSAPVPVLASVTVALTPSTILVGGTAVAVASGADQFGAQIATGAVSWASAPTTVATVSTSGTVTGVAVGQATVTATAGGKTGQATITVNPMPVASVTVSPAAPSIFVGATQQLTATVRDSSGVALTGRTVTWGSSLAGVATVSNSGLVTAVAAGSTTVTATCEGKSGTASITVRPADVWAPTLPQNLRITATSATRLSFAWSASHDNVGVSGYRVSRDGTPLGTTSTTTFSDSGLAASATYAYRVVAFDSAGNVSPPSALFEATTTNGKNLSLARRIGFEVAAWHWGYGGGPRLPAVDDDLIQSAKDVGASVFHLMLPGLENPLGNYLEDEFVKVDYFLASAAERGMYVMPSFLDIFGGAAMQSTNPYYNPTGIEGLVFDGPIKTAFRNLLAKLVNRTNTFNGKKYKDDPAILAWVIGDEPISASFNYPVRPPNLTVRQFREWLEETASFINSLDSRHPVTIFNHPALNSLKDGDWVESLAAPSAEFTYGEDAGMLILNYFPGYSATEYPLRMLALGRPLAVAISFTSGVWPSSICRDNATKAPLLERAIPAYFDAGASMVLLQFWESDLHPIMPAPQFCGILSDASAPIVSAIKAAAAAVNRLP